MRIYFNGSFGNGKTTCKNWVAKEYKIKAIPEIARTVLAEREITTKDQLQRLRADTDLLYQIQKEIIERQFLEEKSSNSMYVTCRGLDSVSFIIEFCRPTHTQEFVNSSLYKDYVKWLKEEDVVTFLVEPNKEFLSQDALRDSSWELSLKLHGIVSALLKTNGIKYELISSPNMSERQNNISNIISSLGAKKEECTHHWKTIGRDKNLLDIIRCSICGYQSTTTGLEKEKVEQKCILHGKAPKPGENFVPYPKCTLYKGKFFKMEGKQ